MNNGDWVKDFVLYGKIASATLSFSAVIAFLYGKLVSPVVRKVTHINETLTKLDTNCIPTLQSSLNRQDVVLGDLKTGHDTLRNEIEKFNVRQDTIERSVDTVHKALLTHLENTSKEKRKRAKA